jgi:hypothetical protein
MWNGWASDGKAVVAEFVGSTPCGGLPREFLGGLATNAPCHYIVWQIALSTNQNQDRRGTYSLTARYDVPTASNPNRSQEGPQVTSRGTWEIVRGKSKPDATAYRITPNGSQRSLTLAKVGENLLHFLNPDGSLMVGNGGASYTLNWADRAEKLVDAEVAVTVPDMSYQISPLATGPTVFGIFEGRSPCHGIAGELKMRQHAGCTKVKWRVTLYHDPKTSMPTRYKVEGSLFRAKAREGNWRIIRGMKTGPEAVVYRLESIHNEAALSMLKGDDNVLFFLNEGGEPMVGHAEFSYTLNRVAQK